MAKQNYLDLAGLQVYDKLIKEKISEEDAKSLKTVKISGTTLLFYKVTNPTDDTVADLSITLPAQDLSGLLEKISGGVVDNVVTIGADGIVKDSGVAVNDLAKKSDVNTVDKKVGNIAELTTTEKTDVVKAINEVKAAVSAGGEAGVVTIETEVTTSGALKSYTVKQGGNTISVIDIPKDLVVTEGTVVVDPEGQEAGTYIKLIIANQKEPLFINVGKLVDVYKAKKNATQIQLAIDSATREISATIVAGSVGTTELADNSITTVKIADANVTLAKLAADAVAAFDTAGSAAAAEVNAKTYADGLNSVITQRVTTLETLVSEGMEPITETQINGLF